MNKTHNVKITKWLLKMINSPVINPMITKKAINFSLFFALLKNSVVSSSDIKNLCNIAMKSEYYQDEEEKKNFFKKQQLSFVSNKEVQDDTIEDLWVGASLFKLYQADPTNIFQKSISQLTINYNEQQKKQNNEFAKGGVDQDFIIAKFNFDSNESIPLLYEKQFPDLYSNENILDYFVPSSFHSHQLFLASIIPIVSLDKNILEFAYLLKGDIVFNTFYQQICDGEYINELLINLICQEGERKIEDQDGYSDLLMFKERSELINCEMIHINQNFTISPLSEYWFSFLSVPTVNVTDLIKKIVVPIKSKYHSGSLGNLSKEDREIIDHLLLHYSLEKSPTNILLYSGSRIDKYNLVVNILAENKLSGYEIPDKVPLEDMKTACRVAQYFISVQDPNAVLVVSKSEKILSKSRMSQRQLLFFNIEVEEDIEQQQLEITLMEDPKVKTIWLSVNPSNMHEDSVSRFTYSAEVKKASREDRKEKIEEILQDFGLSPEFNHKLSQHTELSREQLTNALNLSRKMLCPILTPEEIIEVNKVIDKSFGGALNEEDKAVLGKMHSKNEKYVSLEAKEEIILKAIIQSEKVLNRKGKENLKNSIIKYSLDYLNLNSNFTAEQIIESLKKRPNAKICLFGLPGTGKTQFAEHIAISVDKPIIVKNAGEILGKFVGETEKNIQEMFEEAEEQDAILLLDEGDTFLRDRALSKNSWETSMVNQLLQSMERFNGTFICATNLFDHLDMAALRRFTFKVEFMPLNMDQRWKMFQREVDMSSLSDEEMLAIKEDLDMLPHLTPGDFTVIKNQSEILGKPLTPKEWLDNLSFEMSLKKRNQRIEVGHINTALQ